MNAVALHRISSGNLVSDQMQIGSSTSVAEAWSVMLSLSSLQTLGYFL